MSLVYSVLPADWSSPPAVRRTLERLGPTFVKVGQFLAMRPDLIAEEYCNEFLTLVDHAPTFPWETARRMLTEDLGAPPEERFAWIDTRPLAAASLAQVHLARTHAGHEVAVKVQRENVAARVGRDLRRVRLFSKILEASGMTPLVSPKQLLSEFERWMHEELDLGLELRNLSRMFHLAKNSDTSVVPRPYPELSGKRVLTAEYLRGVPFSELLRVSREKGKDAIRSLSLEPRLLAKNLLEAMLTQVFRYQFFHADTHPGNLIALPDGRVGFVDFGLTDTLDERFKAEMTRYLSSIYSGNTEGMYRALTELLIAGDQTDLDAFHADFLAETRTWMRAKERGQGDPEGRSPIAAYMMGIVAAARRNHMRFPPAMLSMYRSLFTAESIAAKLGRANLRTVGRRFFARLRVDEAAKALEPENLETLALDMMGLARDGPSQVQQVLSDLAADRFSLRVRTMSSKVDERTANERTRLVTAAILQVALAVLLHAADGIPEIDPRLFRLVVAVLLVANGIRAALSWRRLG